LQSLDDHVVIPLPVDVSAEPLASDIPVGLDRHWLVLREVHLWLIAHNPRHFFISFQTATPQAASKRFIAHPLLLAGLASLPHILCTPVHLPRQKQ
jgi:hypothetical protein